MLLIAAAFAVAVLVGGLAGALIIVAALVAFAMFVVENLHVLIAEQQQEEEVGVGRSATRALPADANAGGDA